MTRKERIDEYKNQKQHAGVFQIRNTLNGKVFIEASVNLDKIWNRHQFQLKMGGHPNAALQSDWNAMGESAFVFEVLSEIEQKEGSDVANLNRDLKTLEQLFLEELQPYGERGYHSKKN